MNTDTLKNNPHVTRAQLAALHQDLFRWAYSLVGEEAEDVLQHCYVLILEGKARYEQQSTLKTWLFGVVKNVSRQVQRSRFRQRAGLAQLAVVETGREQTVAESGPVDATSAWLSTAIRALPAQQREVLELHAYRDFSLSECALIMKISVGSVRTHYHRAKIALREKLEASHD